MTHRRFAARCSRALLAAWASLLLLTGCTSIDITLTVHGDTLDGTVLFAADTRFLASSGMSEERFLKQLEPGFLPGSPPGETYRDGQYVGVRYKISDLPLTDTGDLRRYVDITRHRQTGRYEVAGELDLTQLAVGLDPALMADSMRITLAITFPGEVVAHNGELAGTTVTWRPRPGEKTPIRATADDGTPAIAWIVALAGTASLAVAATAWLLVRRNRRLRAPTQTDDK